MTSFFGLTSAEAMATAEAIETLRPLSRSGALLERTGGRGGLSTENMATLFEVRVSRALHDCGIAPIYEHPPASAKPASTFLMN